MFFCFCVLEAPSHELHTAPIDTLSDAQSGVMVDTPQGTSPVAPSTSHTNPTANVTTRTTSDSSRDKAATILSDEAPIESPSVSGKDTTVDSSKTASDLLIQDLQDGFPSIRAAQTAAGLCFQRM